MSEKLVKVRGKGERDGVPQDVYLFWCPGCKEPHPYEVPAWQWNGSMDRPTFTPSLLCNANVEEGRRRCHLFMTDGKLAFCGDCHHELAGRTVECPDWENER